MDTNGWDVVCVCTASKLNELLAIQFAKVPASLSYNEPSSGTTIQADFDAWRIVEGGSDKKLHLELPVKAGTVTTALSTLKLDGAIVVVEVELAFVRNVKASTNDLRFNFQAIATQAGDPTSGSIYVSSSDTTGILSKRDPLGAAIREFSEDLPKCLIANRDKLAYVFTALNLTPAGDGSWLAPQHPAYAYSPATVGQPGCLVVFSVITDRETSSLKTTIDPALAKGKSDVCVAIAGPVFLEHVIMPQLPPSYVNAKAADFVMSGNTIKNHDNINCPPVTYSLTSYHPVLSSLTISIDGEDITSTSNGSFAITGLAKSSVSFTLTSKAKCNYDVKKGQLSLTADGKPTSSYQKHIPWWIYLVASIVADVIIAAVTTSVAKRVSAGGLSNTDLPFANWTAESIKWPGFEKWTIDSGELDDAFALWCNLKT